MRLPPHSWWPGCVRGNTTDLPSPEIIEQLSKQKRPIAKQIVGRTHKWIDIAGDSMTCFSKTDDFMGGIYIIELDSSEEVDIFIDRYRDCPVWPIMTKGIKENQVFIFAIELKHQAHGDFTQENNTLVKHPHYLGAREIIFR